MDIEPEIILEDGEITDDDEPYKPLERPAQSSNTFSKHSSENALGESTFGDDLAEYTPLERPQNFASTFKPSNLEKISDNESDFSSISDSDSDEYGGKKPKAKIKKRFKKCPVKRKKYDVWSSHVQEDVLAETLVSCDVSRIDRSRNIESYHPFDLRSKITAKRGKHTQGNKRRHDQRNFKNVSTRRKDDSDEDEVKISKRIILDLVTSVDNEDEEVAKDIANKLCEEKDNLIMRIVQIAGKKKAIEIFNDTKRIELDGGMLVMNGTKRRTPGGVFIFLLKRDDDITSEQQKEIFAEERQEQIRHRKSQQKAKLKVIKDQIAAKKTANEKLPLLLSRSDLEAKKASLLRDRNESEPEDFVNNPPPSPVTDGKENSNDGMSNTSDDGSIMDTF